MKKYHEPVERLRRIYKEALAGPADEGGGFLIRLDGRPARTPAGARLRLPTAALAELVATEWAAQGETMEFAQMHATRLAFTALDAIPAAREATAQAVAGYAGSDLLCYWAEEPPALTARQAAHWGPMLERAEAELACAFVRASGIVHREQPAETLARIRAEALALDDFGLAGLAFAASLFGSAILALALHRGWLSGEQAFELSRLDEAYQQEKWGVDEEAAERTARLADEARMLEAWFRALATGHGADYA